MNSKEKLKELKVKVVTGIGIAKLKLKEGAQKVKKWACENPEDFATIVVGVAGLTVKAARSNKKGEHYKEVYDPRLAMWHPVKRKLKYKEELYYKNEVLSGRAATDVLKEMRLYKK